MRFSAILSPGRWINRLLHHSDTGHRSSGPDQRLDPFPLPTALNRLGLRDSSS